MDERIRDLFINAFSFQTRMNKANKDDKKKYAENLASILIQINHIRPNEHLQSSLRKLYSYCPDNKFDMDYRSIDEDIKKAMKEMLKK